MCWPVARGCLSSWLALVLGVRSWWLAECWLWCELRQGWGSCRTLGSQLAITWNNLSLLDWPRGQMLHPASQDHAAHLSSDLESSCAVAWLLPLSGKTSLQLLREVFFPFSLLISSWVTVLFLPVAPLWSGLHLAPCTGCLPALCGTPRGGFSPVWVLCHCRETQGAAEERGSTGPWSLLSPSVTHKIDVC